MPLPVRIGALALSLSLSVLVNLAPLPAWAAPSSPAEALHVLQRLSFGPAPGELQRVANIGVDAYIAEQLHPERLPLSAPLQSRLDNLSSHALTLADRVEAQRPRQDPAPGTDAADAKTLQEDAAAARLWRATLSPRQLEEVMVDFWFNHFNVFEGKGLDKAWTGAYEDQAIRPHALGRFRDLLGATAHHPAMLFYLDNWLSSAPGEVLKAGKVRVSGLNENYARELMELHTLGVDGGYTQADVTELARIFTGWTLRRPGQMAGRDDPDIAFFDARRHDHGDKQWLGATVHDRGEAEGEWALDVLARHPATARHIALQLARHFVSDQPPPELVQALAQRFTDTDGDVRAVLATLFDSQAFRRSAGLKLKTPLQFVVSALRATGQDLLDVKPAVRALQQLGMPLYGCQTPDGWPDTEAAWLNPEGLARRINLAVTLGSGRWHQDAQQREPLNASELIATLGPGLSAHTLDIVQTSPMPLQAGLILGSPDFMRH